MASEGMILTNHDHQIRVGVLTGKSKYALYLKVSAWEARWVKLHRLSVLSCAAAVCEFWGPGSASLLARAVAVLTVACPLQSGVI